MSAARAALAAGGVLARRLPGFVPRDIQQRMAAAVESALADGARLLVEAGTGTGKTYAYLIPALLSGRRVIIATGTKNLQDQLFQRDLPQLRTALGVAARVAVLKGRSNYLCWYRLQTAQQDAHRRGRARALAELAAWARASDDGDLNAYGRLQPALAAAATSTTDNCLGSKCPEFERCFVVRARRAAQAADLVVVNHHLLFSEFRLREDGFGMLPEADAVIVDEAHQLPELAPQFFGERLSCRMLAELSADIAAICTRLGDLPALEQTVDGLDEATARLTACFAELAAEDSASRLPWAAAPPELPPALTIVAQGVSLCAQALRAVADREPELGALLQRADTLLRRLELFRAELPSSWVRWLEGGRRGGVLQAAPIETQDAFRRLFEVYPGAWVFTSATLAVGDDFGHMITALGLPEARRLRLDSPFDYAEQARLYLPPDIPDPNDPRYADAVASALIPVLEASGGGAFVLCTSRRASERIAARLRTLPLPLLVQDDAGKAELVARFAELGNAVLVGTASFWEGVDVRGPALRVVAIDRLPFTAPGDPLFDARLAAVRSAGGNPFNDFQLPRMITALRQGVGRLIRDRNDRGLIVLCDPRLTARGYGSRALSALPPIPRLENTEQIRHWFDDWLDRRQPNAGAPRAA